MGRVPELGDTTLDPAAGVGGRLALGEGGGPASDSLNKEVGSTEPGMLVPVAEVEEEFMEKSDTGSSSKRKRERWVCDVAGPYIGWEHPG